MILAFLIGSPVLASGKVWALYAGIADYKNGGETSRIHDLQAAPNDVEMFSRVLGSRQRIAGQITLLGPRATRAGILAAIEDMTGRASAGDTFVFYFSGHGRRFITRGGDQADGYNVTIAAWDALPPEKIRPDRNYRVGDIGDVFDRELRVAFDRITDHGVNVVTVFDSCNSGSATRSAFRRRADKQIPDVKEVAVLVEEPPPPAGPPARAVKPGYRVHFAAAPDGQVAHEAAVDEAGVEVWRSDFTVALSTALVEARPGVTYEELLRSTRTKLALGGAGQQQVTADGPLMTPFLGEGPAVDGVRVFEVTPGAAGVATLAAGSLAGVAAGSDFDLYATLPEALEGRQPALAKAIVKSTDAWTAQLALSRPILDGAVATYARETRRNFSQTLLKVRIVLAEGVKPSARTRAATSDLRVMLKDLSAVRIVDRDPQVGFEVGADGVVTLRTLDMREIARFTLGQTEALSTAVKSLAKFYTLLSLNDGGEGPAVTFEASDVDCQGGEPTTFERLNGEPNLTAGQEMYLIARNEDEEPFFLYVFNLGQDHSVDLIAASDNALSPGRCWNSRRLKAFGDGRDHLMLIASKNALPALRSLQQGAVRSIATDPLEALLADSKDGQRSTRGVGIGAWGVRRMTYSVHPPASATRLPEPRSNLR